jgi:tripartite-type tricarboxylate transporter receptor subunit TctC
MIVAPARIPKSIVERLHGELKAIVALPEFQKQMLELGMIAVESLSPDAPQPFIDSEIERWSKIVHQAGIAGSE